MQRTPLLISIAAACLALGTPAHAAPSDRTDSVVDDVAAFERDIEDAAATEVLSSRDASYLRGRAKSIRSFFNKVSRDGISLAEAQLLRDRISFLRGRYNLQGSNPTTAMAPPPSPQ